MPGDEKLNQLYYNLLPTVYGKKPDYDIKGLQSMLSDSRQSQQIYSDISKFYQDKGKSFMSYTDWRNIHIPTPATTGNVTKEIPEPQIVPTTPPPDNTGLATVSQSELQQEPGANQPVNLIPPGWEQEAIDPQQQAQEQQYNNINNVWKPVVSEMVDTFTREHNDKVLNTGSLFPDEEAGVKPIDTEQIPPQKIQLGIPKKDGKSIFIPDDNFYKLSRNYAYQYSKEGNYTESDNILKQLINENPNDDYLLQLESYNRKKQGDSKGAFESINTAIALAEKNDDIRPELYLNRASIGVEANQKVTAFMDAERYIKSHGGVSGDNEELAKNLTEAYRVKALISGKPEDKKQYINNLANAKKLTNQRQTAERNANLTSLVDSFLTKPETGLGILFAPIAGLDMAIGKIKEGITGQGEIIRQVEPGVTQKEIEELSPSTRAVLITAGLIHGGFALAGYTPFMMAFNAGINTASNVAGEENVNKVMAPFSSSINPADWSKLSRTEQEAVAGMDLMMFIVFMGAAHEIANIPTGGGGKARAEKAGKIYEKVINDEPLTETENAEAKEMASNAPPETVETYITKVQPELKNNKTTPNEKPEETQSQEAETQTKPTEPEAVEAVKAEKPEEIIQKTHAQNIKVKFRTTFKEKGVDEEQIEGAIALMETRAKSWASEEQGRTPDQWYKGISNIKQGEFEKGTSKAYQILGEVGASNIEGTMDNLIVAKEMEAKGKDVKDIRIATGWEKGVDGKWRYEIDDSMGYLFKSLQDYVKDAKKQHGEDIFNNKQAIQKELKFIYSNPKLYQAYPELMDVLVSIEKLPSDEVGFTDGKNIVLNSNYILSKSETKSIFIHEIQHLIQRKEGFAVGTDIKEQRQISARRLYNKLYSDLSNRQKDIVDSQAQGEYDATAGEVEARNVSKRMDYTPEQRLQESLQDSEDVARDQQIVIKDLLLQKNKGDIKGAVETLADGSKVIHAMKSPDFSTMVHEISHVFESDLTKPEQNIVKDFGGSEKFARGFERYLRDGEAPTVELKALFDKFKQWLTDIYSKLKGSPIEGKITPEIKDIFDRLLTEKKEPPTESGVSEAEKKSPVSGAVGAEPTPKGEAPVSQEPTLTKSQEKAEKKDKIREVLSEEPQDAEEGILQYFLSGNRIETSQFLEATGVKKGSTEAKQGIGFVKNGGQSVDNLHEVIPILEGLSKSGAKDIMNAVGEVLRSYPTKGKMLERLLEIKAEREGKDSMQDYIPEDWIAPVEEEITTEIQAQMPKPLQTILEDEGFDVNTLKSAEELRTLVEKHKDEFNDSFPYTKDEYNEVIKFIEDHETGRIDRDRQAIIEKVSETINPEVAENKAEKGKLETELDTKVERIDKEIADTQKARQKKLDTLNVKNELDLGVSKSNELDLGVSETVDSQQVKEILKPFDDKLSELEREKAKLGTQTETVKQADKSQTEIPLVENKSEPSIVEETVSDLQEKLASREITKKEYDQKIEGLRNKLKDSLKKAKDIWSEGKNLGFAFDPKREAERQYDLHKALVEVVKDAIAYHGTKAIKTVQDLANAIGEPITRELKFAFTAATKKGEDELRQMVAQDIQKKKDDIEKVLYGSVTKKTEDFKKATSFVNKVLGLPVRLQENTFGKLSDIIGDGMAKLLGKAIVNENKNIRNSAKGIESLLKNVSRSIKDTQRGEEFKGTGMDRALSDAEKSFKELTKQIGGDEESLKRLNQVIDDDFYRERTQEEFVEELRTKYGDSVDGIEPEKLDEMYQSYREKMGFDDPERTIATYDDLSPKEQAVVDIIRGVYDYIHDINFVIGKLDFDTYMKNKGQYNARVYDKYEFPEDTQIEWDKVKGLVMQSEIYKHREGITEWKAEHLIENPLHGMSKRLFQTLLNKSIYDYSIDITNNKPEWVSKIEMPGFTLMGNGYGKLSQKWLRSDIAEDFRGIFYTNKVLQKVHEVFSSYDRSWPRRMYRKLFTVFTPSTQVGNFLNNIPLAMATGVSPMRMQYNFWSFAVSEVKNYGSTYRYLLDKGLLNSDLTRTDLLTTFKEFSTMLKEQSNSPGVLKKINDFATKTYRVNDELAKIAAFKSLIDLGIKPEVALNRVANGFQNSKRVGKAYDFASKTPAFGMMFARWGGDLGRIITHAATRRPLNIAALVATWHLAAYVASKLSGETDEERKVRESRSTAKIPMPDLLGGDIPLTWKIGKNELNIARFMSPVYIYQNAEIDDRVQMLNRILPFQYEQTSYTMNPKGTFAVSVAKSLKDPLLAPWIQRYILNSDWRGTPILDPNQTKYDVESNLSSFDKQVNGARYIFRSVVPYGALLDDFIATSKDGTDYYNRERTPGQVMLRWIGWNSQTFDDAQYYKTAISEIETLDRKLEDLSTMKKSLNTLLDKGRITPEKYDRRSAELVEKEAILQVEVNKIMERHTAYIKSIPSERLPEIKRKYQELMNKK